MVNILISFFVIITSFGFFSYTYTLNGVNRFMLSTPIEYFNASIPLVSKEEEIVLYFDKTQLEKYLDDYYLGLKKYVDNYQISYYYFNPNDDSLCVSENCQGVRITCECKILNLYEYSRSLDFEIGSRND